MKSLREHLGNVPLVALVLANMAPIYGVVYFGWDAFNIVLLYWAENVVIGFYSVLKIMFAKAEHPIVYVFRLFPAAFFVLHYGAFVGVHGVFIFALFSKDKGSDMMGFGGHSWPCFLVFVQILVNVIRHCWLTIPADMKYAIGVLFVSHGVSFVRNYLMGGEYLTSATKDLMGQPYARIMIMHVAIILGGFVSMSMGSPMGVLIVLVVLKTIIDVKLHLRQHQTRPRPAGAENGESKP
jgi:hypothetical protein